MAGKLSADVIFCLDASGSMAPCFDALRRHLGSFLDGLRSGGQVTWDVRFDFLAHRAVEKNGHGVHHFQSLNSEGMELVQSMYQPQSSSSVFFTSDTERFKAGLAGLRAYGDEASFVALDTCLDFPWRDASLCHRVVILLTDEALETGVCLAEQRSKIDALVEKLHALRVKIFLVGPSSEAFDALCAADRSEYLVVDGAQAGLASVDLGKVLEVMGKSVSVSLTQSTAGEPAVTRGLFGQSKWTPTTANFLES